MKLTRKVREIPMFTKLNFRKLALTKHKAEVTAMFC
jgi:hypothetical protein